MSQRERQTARVNVDDATWQAVRIRAIQANRSVADELARLVGNNLRRSLRTEAPKPSTDEPSAAETPEPIAPAPSKAAPVSVRRGRPKQRLAGLDLMSELPYRDQPRP